ncbi:MAG: cytidine deaminase [Clostridia bacterium]|nr:cytidine deaminase [Clostridia bacterium]MBO7404231.1 cytidine deaminase [Clostridia bacterium]
MTNADLIAVARGMTLHSYAPYSHYRVGAALLCRDGRVYTGCNIENAAFGPTVCAERVAFFSAVRDGERDFDRIAIVGGEEGRITAFAAPCGVCRQVMREFCRDDFVVVLSDGREIREFTLAALLPQSFSPANLGKE